VRPVRKGASFFSSQSFSNSLRTSIHGYLPDRVGFRAFAEHCRSEFSESGTFEPLEIADSRRLEHPMRLQRYECIILRTSRLGEHRDSCGSPATVPQAPSCPVRPTSAWRLESKVRMKPLPLPLLELSAPCPPLCEQRQRLAKLETKCDGPDPHLSTTHAESAQTATVPTGPGADDQIPSPSGSRMRRSLLDLCSNRIASGSTPHVWKPAFSYRCCAATADSLTLRCRDVTPSRVRA
jgi:hypothetical protein